MEMEEQEDMVTVMMGVMGMDTQVRQEICSSEGQAGLGQCAKTLEYRENRMGDLRF